MENEANVQKNTEEDEANAKKNGKVKKKECLYEKIPNEQQQQKFLFVKHSMYTVRMLCYTIFHFNGNVSVRFTH